MAADEELPWTTSRCNRLLRPLSSKLTKLRTEVERLRSAGAEVRSFSTAFATKCLPQKTTNFTRPANKPRGFEKARDPDWRPGAKAGAGKKTYGGRGARKVAGIQRGGSDTGHVARPGEIAFTPLVARMGGPLQSSPQVQASPLKKYGKNRGPLQVNIDWAQMPGDLRKLVQGISEAYANVLQATADCDGKSWKGTRSLMGACLRKLPAYIELEAHFAKLDREADDEDERDITAEIYEHLETQFEQRVGQGWRPFRQVVRAHATSLLCDAMADEVISLESVTVLVTHCIRVSAWDEAEQLLTSRIPVLEPLGMPLSTKADLFDGQKSPYLRAVKEFVDHTGRHRLLFSLLEHMIAFELLPLEWLATEHLRPVWDRLVRSICSSDPRTVAEATRFFQTVTMAGMGLPDERLLADETDSIRRFVLSSRDELRQALETTYSSLVTVLCSIALVNNSREDEAGRQITRQVTSALDSVVIAIFNRDDIKDEIQLLEADEEDVQVFAQRAMSMLFASFLVHLDNCCVKDFTASLDVANLIGGFKRMTSEYPLTTFSTSSIFGSLPTLVSSVARGTGRIWKDDGFEQLQRLVQGLILLSGQQLPHKLWTFKRLALESATTFAQETSTSEHMIYARDIERKMRIQGRLVISPVKTDSPSSSGGFRWEEGIGEWVACTPFAGKQAVKRVACRPPPVFELLPTPAQSEDDHILPGDAAEESLDSREEPSGSFYDDEYATAPHSSPIKRQSRTSISSLGKRQRASSPMVIVPSKRSHLTSPDAPVKYYPLLPEEKETEDEPRRSSRSMKHMKANSSHFRTQRTRTASGSGLREQRRKSYIAQHELEMESDNTDASSDDEESTAASSDSNDESRARPQRRSISSKTRQTAQYDGAYDDEDEDDRDDLGITPARPQRTTTKSLRVQPALRKQTRPVRSQWWKVRGAFVGDSEDDGSEDELSFH